MSFFDKLKETVAEGLKKSADEVEIYFQRSKSLKIKAHKAKVESLTSSDSCGFGIRVFKEGRTGYAFASGADKESVDKSLNAAIKISTQTGQDEANGLPEKNISYKNLDLDLYSQDIARSSIEKKIDMTLEMEQKALELDPRIRGTEHVSYGEEIKEIYLVNSKGFADRYKSSACGLFLSVIAGENGRPQTGYSFMESRSISDLDISEISKEAVYKATVLLGAKPISTAEVPVVFDSMVTAQMLGILAPSMSGESARKQRSLFTGKLNQPVAVNGLGLIDDGLMEEGLASSPFDDEGSPRQKNVIIEEGKLIKLLHNTCSARKEHLRSTGNAFRGFYGNTPEIAPTNFYLKPGKFSKEEIISSVDNGFFVMEMQGVHSGTNSTTGEISVGAKGLWIRKGKLSDPVSEITIAGNLREILFNIEMIGSDLRFFPMGGNYGAPTIKISKMVISGG